ncbi:MAG: AraC family transcriptional regulator [Defluviitaleaceae bacterium]|nr:AraC family transcriptional regulator [Defluviitaleaceae bacterium]
MEYITVIQSVLDEIDRRITEKIKVDELARAANYSTYHFCRVFLALTGTPVMNYVTRRKLEYAQHDLSRGKRIIEVAMDYGFDTHAGFAKAFKKCFGFPPSLCRLRFKNELPQRMTVNNLKLRHGGFIMTPYITVATPFIVAGRTNRHKMPNVRTTADIPAFDFDEVRSGVHDLLDGTSKLFSKSDAIKHCEIEMCYDVDEDSGEFTYFAGRGIFHADDLENILPDMESFEVSGLYAIFTTPLSPFEQREQSAKTIRDTWQYIFAEWLPNSEFEYDETRRDFEFHDNKCHGWYFDCKKQSEIHIPIRQCEDARIQSQNKMKTLWEEEMKRREGI